MQDTMMQFFEWYLPADSKHWKRVENENKRLSELGINYVWLPPAYKGAGGKNDVGYGVYDLYDLGEFYQKETVATKYGTKDEYLHAIKSLKECGIKTIVDIVLNHKMGADYAEEVLAIQEDSENRKVDTSRATPIIAWTGYEFLERNNKYSSFKWNWTHFHGIDWDDKTKTSSIYKFYGKHWDDNVDDEKGNYDYLMGADIDLNNFDVIIELHEWGKWYMETTGGDGVRLDAIKHIRADFFPDWIDYVSSGVNKKLFAVGEYWSGDLEKLKNYLDKTNHCMKLFDVPLHYNFYSAATSNGQYDMRRIFDRTLVKENPESAVTFVDNHDTEPGQALESWVPDWFKPHAYSLILLRESGMPCVFYGDYYGIEEKNVSSKNELLNKLMKLRQEYAYGEQVDYFENEHVIGFVRKGDNLHENSGLIVVMTNSTGGSIKVDFGEKFVKSEYYDYLNNVSDTVIVDNSGVGEFKCNDGSVSIWVKKN